IRDRDSLEVAALEPFEARPARLEAPPRRAACPRAPRHARHLLEETHFVPFILLGIRFETRSTAPIRNDRSRIGRPDQHRGTLTGAIAAVAPGGRFVPGSHVPVGRRLHPGNNRTAVKPFTTREKVRCRPLRARRDGSCQACGDGWRSLESTSLPCNRGEGAPSHEPPLV